MEFSKLNNFYWFIRNARNKPIKRKYYRYVSVEKKRLIEQIGVDPEELRLYCCSLSGRLNVHAERNLLSYRKKCLKDHISS